jgi:AcrR family transcriptional regulator
MTMPVADRLTEAALAVAAEHGWCRLTMAEVARHAGVALTDAYDTFPDRTALLAGILAATDRAVLAAGDAEGGESPSDRLFEVMMRRFDVLQTRREGYRAILRDLPADPCAAIALMPRFARSLAWMLEAAGLSSAGLAGNLRTKALAVIYFDALRVWLTDDSADMAKTMAVLDKNLSRARQLAGCCPLLSGRASSSKPPEPPQTAPDSPATEVPD